MSTLQTVTAADDAIERKAAGFKKPFFLIQSTNGWAALDVRELWRYRDLLLILIERDIRLRYKQTALGVLWVVLQPLIAAAIFATIFGRLAKMPSEGEPYLLFVFCGLTAWTFFSQALQRASNSLVANSQLVSKVYFPRLLIPLAHTLAVLLDLAVMIVILFALMMFFHVSPTLRLLTLPFFLFLATITAAGVSLWFSALSVKYRDFMHTLPFLVQVWLYASPVVYPASIIPAPWRNYYALNPAVGFIEGVRWSALGHSSLSAAMLWITTAAAGFAFLSGVLFFRRVERQFADVI